MQLKRKYENLTRQNIVKCAARLFADNGFHGTGVREIVDKAGVALNSVNYYFGSKENLFLESIKYVLKEKIQFDQVFVSDVEIPTKPQELANFTKARLAAIFDIFFGTNRRYWYADLVTRAFQEEVPEALDVAIVYLNLVFNNFGEIYSKAKGKMDEKEYFLWLSRLWFNVFGFSLWRHIFGKEYTFAGYAASNDRDAFLKNMEELVIAKTIEELGLPKAK
ncbi:MAG: TetR/AcrR family transcriptional regulator [Candidatus Cloacimonetes bacterium]|nr:TetR/AcrR family transcriptional regulator [Candidatus Cloacimonadota bacterium]